MAWLVSARGSQLRRLKPDAVDLLTRSAWTDTDWPDGCDNLTLCTSSSWRGSQKGLRLLLTHGAVEHFQHLAPVPCSNHKSQTLPLPKILHFLTRHLLGAGQKLDKFSLGPYRSIVRVFTTNGICWAS